MAELILPDESYKLMGILFQVHNELGPICKEKNYCDAIEHLLKKEKIPYKREAEVAIPFDNSKIKGFFVDFIIDNKIVLEIKAKSFIKHEDVRQTLRYLKATGLLLAIIANFKRAKLEYKRLINAEHSSDIRRIREGLGQVLGVDHGSKRIGLALADKEVKIATPFLTLENKGWQDNLKNIKEIINQEDILEIVVGLPLSLSGGESDQTREVKKFFNLLKGNIDIPVVLEDERLSSKQVDSLIKKFNKKVDRDAVSAMLILQNFLDKQR